ncbi:ABC transporter substrate-binding protein [Rhodoplanes roseus]|uniref:Sulfonate ABC transporter n=1 Tax=Rhodoplanes roseus TaxID=29409 RepID=A0A327L176_9BRAD|nr:ABC transporter substrate-binding protein [Rhodoplanes roseus]RAI44137.1 sulfonate ABC transporter [Rhodoplanes roseus]
MTRFPLLSRLAAAGLALALAVLPARADDTLKLAVGARGNWDTVVPAIGQKAGIFKKHGLDLEILYTQGGGETLQAVITGGVDIGIAAGTTAVLSAFVKGAPVRILLGGTTGSGDLYWYVPAGSPITSLKEAAGKTAGYSTNGASTHTTLLKLLRHYDSQAKPVATGASPATYTQVMSQQIDIGWASPPFGLEQLDDGKIRLIARGSDVPATRDQTVRVHIVNSTALAQKAEAIKRFVAGYRETYEWLYSAPEAMSSFSEIAGVSPKLSARIRDEFMPKPAMNPDMVSGLGSLMDEALALKALPRVLSEKDLDEVVRGPKWKL